MEMYDKTPFLALCGLFGVSKNQDRETYETYDMIVEMHPVMVDAFA